jgi:hypothetical protein
MRQVREVLRLTTAGVGLNEIARRGDAVGALIDALDKEGIAATAREQNPTNNPTHNKITIDVGAKP